MLESSTNKTKIAEKSMDCNTKGVGSPEIPIVSEVFKNEEDDDAIFKKLNIPWLSEKASSFQEGKCIDSENENLQKTVKQYKYQINFLNETNEGLVMTNRRLWEDLKDINTHYHELIMVSKEALKRKR